MQYDFVRTLQCFYFFSYKYPVGQIYNSNFSSDIMVYRLGFENTIKELQKGSIKFSFISQSRQNQLCVKTPDQ